MMVRVQVRMAFALALLCLNAPSAIAGAILENQTVMPLNPAENDVISIDIDGYFFTSGHDLIGVPGVMVIGNEISISIASTGCPDICATVLTPFSQTALIGPLSAGTYNDTISIYENGELVDTLEGSFNVDPAPRLRPG